MQVPNWHPHIHPSHSRVGDTGRCQQQVLEKAKVRNGMSEGWSWPLLLELLISHGQVLPLSLDKVGAEAAGVVCVPA